MLVIRLTKMGKKGEAKYRIVVNEKRSRRDGKAVELLGWYHKQEGNKEAKKINQKRVDYWISQGAHPSPTVKKILGL